VFISKLGKVVYIFVNDDVEVVRGLVRRNVAGGETL
jgi:hypothetical protein